MRNMCILQTQANGHEKFEMEYNWIVLLRLINNHEITIQSTGIIFCSWWMTGFKTYMFEHFQKPISLTYDVIKENVVDVYVSLNKNPDETMLSLCH